MENCKSGIERMEKIDEKILKEKIRELYRSKMIRMRKNSDESYTLILTEKGKLKALTYYFQEIEIQRKNWDGKWRIVVFDIPEKLKTIGFYKLQESIFVFPYECKNEIDFIVEFFNLRRCVRFGVLESIDNELHLKKIFGLL